MLARTVGSEGLRRAGGYASMLLIHTADKLVLNGILSSSPHGPLHKAT